MNRYRLDTDTDPYTGINTDKSTDIFEVCVCVHLFRNDILVLNNLLLFLSGEH